MVFEQLDIYLEKMQLILTSYHVQKINSKWTIPKCKSCIIKLLDKNIQVAPFQS